MALINHPDLYTGGAVQFDSRPHVQLYGQLMAKKKAEQDAFDDYIRNLNKTVNSAGLRNVDRQIFDKKLADWQRFGMENREAIRKRAGGADIKFMQDYQDILNLVAESKGEEEKKKPLVEIMLDPNKRELLDESSIEGISAHDEPLYVMDQQGTVQRNPSRKSFDYNSISFNPKPFDQDKFFDQFKEVKRMDLPPKVEIDPATKTQTTTTTSVFDQEAKDLIATRGVAEYMNNRSFKKLVDGLDPNQYNDFFKQNYGRDIQNEADLAAAYTLKGMQQKTVKTDVGPDVFGRQKEMAAIQDQYARGRLAMQQAQRKAIIDYRRSGTKQDQDQVLEAWIQRTFNEGKGTYNPVMVKGKFIPGRQIAVPMDLKKKYTLTSGTGEDKVVEAPRFVMTEDKKFVVPLYPGRKSDYQEAIPIETFRNELGKMWLSAKDRVGEMDEISFDNEDGIEDVTTTIISEPEEIDKSQVPKGASVTKDAEGNVYYNGKKIKM